MRCTCALLPGDVWKINTSVSRTLNQHECGRGLLDAKHLLILECPADDCGGEGVRQHCSRRQLLLHEPGRVHVQGPSRLLALLLPANQGATSSQAKYAWYTLVAHWRARIHATAEHLQKLAGLALQNLIHEPGDKPMPGTSGGMLFPKIIFGGRVRPVPMPPAFCSSPASAPRTLMLHCRTTQSRRWMAT